ncbi:SH3 domain-containing protein [Boseongicola aestuarii]|uniref:Inhibitor of g-type lysozyme n=1 Tax=Boseongicola aestuarii TaxID=1470561 RepID=A0A238J4A4_9RHOB|nr:SH3 domain-containing protein [Boseongicola aestuarii]SMX25447.1 Inhibitor of g-type lysozyme precursor [Boseongicola aestuarii]
MTLLRHFIAFTLFVATTMGALAQDRTFDVRFPAGTTGTTIEGDVSGRDAVLYRVGAEAGQSMSVVLSSDNLATYFNVYAPGRSLGDEALAIGEMSDPINDWSGTLPTSGEYTIAVFLYRSAARRGETSKFRLDVSVVGSTGDEVRNDFADGLAGGPDFLEVAVTGGGTLNLRAGPSGGASIVTRLSNGQNVRNLGCRMAEGRRWCRVATLADPGYEGWAAGDFLVEGVAEVSSDAPGMSVGDGEERVQFAAGASGAELRGQLAPGESRRYILNARNGQNLYVRVGPQGGPMTYQIFNPDRSFLLDQVSSEQEYRGQLWQSGDYVVEVINRTNSVASYSVIMGIE